MKAIPWIQLGLGGVTLVLVLLLILELRRWRKAGTSLADAASGLLAGKG